VRNTNAARSAFKLQAANSFRRISYLQNSANSRMIGNGIPISHSSAPLPNVMSSSVVTGQFGEVTGRRPKSSGAQRAAGRHHTSTTPTVEAASPAIAMADRYSFSSTKAISADAPGTTKKPDEARPAPWRSSITL